MSNYCIGIGEKQGLTKNQLKIASQGNECDNYHVSLLFVLIVIISVTICIIYLLYLLHMLSSATKTIIIIITLFHINCFSHSLLLFQFFIRSL